MNPNLQEDYIELSRTINTSVLTEFLISSYPYLKFKFISSLGAPISIREASTGIIYTLLNNQWSELLNGSSGIYVTIDSKDSNTKFEIKEYEPNFKNIVDDSHNWGEQTAVESGKGLSYFPDNGTLAYSNGSSWISLSGGGGGSQVDLIGHITSVGNNTSLGSFTLAHLNAALSDANVATGGGTATGSNTGDQDLSGYAPILGADDNYVTDAEKTKLVNLSGANTGDQNINAANYGFAPGNTAAANATALQSALNAISTMQNKTLFVPAGSYVSDPVVVYDNGIADYTGHGNITILGDGHPSVNQLRARTYTKGTVIKFSNSTGSGLTLSGSSVAQNIVLQNICFAGNTTGFVVKSDYSPELLLNNVAIVNEHDNGSGLSIAQCWFTKISTCWFEYVGTGISTGTGLLLAAGTTSGGLISVEGESSLQTWGYNFKVDDASWTNIILQDSEIGNASIAGIYINAATDSFSLRNAYFEGNVQDLVTTALIKVLDINGAYVLGGSASSGNALPRLSIAGGAQSSCIKNIYCFRSFSNLIELAGDAAIYTTSDIANINLYHDAISALTKNITGADNNGSGLIRVTIANHGYSTERKVKIASVGGTVEAIGEWEITVINANTFDLIGSTFTNTYTSGGTSALLCYAVKPLTATMVPSIQNVIATGALTGLEATGAYRIMDTKVTGLLSYSSHAGIAPAGLAARYIDAVASGTTIAIGFEFNHRRYVATTSTIIDVSVSASTAKGLDGRFIFISNDPTSTARLQIRQANDSSTKGYLAPGETAVLFEDRINRVLIIKRFQIKSKYATTAASTYTMDYETGSLVCTAACTVTLPTASTCIDRFITIRTTGANAIISASSNVTIDGVTGTAILAATAGKWARLQSDGTNWIMLENN